MGQTHSHLRAPSSSNKWLREPPSPFFFRLASIAAPGEVVSEQANSYQSGQPPLRVPIVQQNPAPAHRTTVHQQDLFPLPDSASPPPAGQLFVPDPPAEERYPAVSHLDPAVVPEGDAGEENDAETVEEIVEDLADFDVALDRENEEDFEAEVAVVQGVGAIRELEEEKEEACSIHPVKIGDLEEVSGSGGSKRENAGGQFVKRPADEHAEMANRVEQVVIVGTGLTELQQQQIEVRGQQLAERDQHQDAEVSRLLEKDEEMGGRQKTCADREQSQNQTADKAADETGQQHPVAGTPTIPCARFASLPSTPKDAPKNPPPPSALDSTTKFPTQSQEHENPYANAPLDPSASTQSVLTGTRRIEDPPEEDSKKAILNAALKGGDEILQQQRGEKTSQQGPSPKTTSEEVLSKQNEPNSSSDYGEAPSEQQQTSALTTPSPKSSFAPSAPKDAIYLPVPPKDASILDQDNPDRTDHENPQTTAVPTDDEALLPYFGPIVPQEVAVVQQAIDIPVGKFGGESFLQTKAVTVMYPHHDSDRARDQHHDGEVPRLLEKDEEMGGIQKTCPDREQSQNQTLAEEVQSSKALLSQAQIEDHARASKLGARQERESLMRKADLEQARFGELEKVGPLSARPYIRKKFPRQFQTLGRRTCVGRDPFSSAVSLSFSAVFV